MSSNKSRSTVEWTLVVGVSALAIVNLCFICCVIAAAWRWHAVPLGADELSMRQALVLLLVLRAVQYKYKPVSDADFKDQLEEQLGSVFGNAFVWSFVGVVAWLAA